MLLCCAEWHGLDLGTTNSVFLLPYKGQPGHSLSERSVKIIDAVVITVPILYTPALRWVDSIPDPHSEFSELKA
jgi:hypothetical protein